MNAPDDMGPRPPGIGDGATRAAVIPCSAAVAAGFVVAALSIGLLPGMALAQPSLQISPINFQAGDVVQVTVSGFTPGGYQGTITVDGSPVESFFIPNGGSTTYPWTTPSSLTAGGHDVYVCASCLQGDLEQRSNTVRVTVLTGTLPDYQYNLQVWGIEITQGVRGDFALRTPPDADLNLPPESVVHVANRRTIVRVYPWVEGGPYFQNVLDVHAQLWVTRDGDSYGPIDADPVSRVRANATLEDLRSDLDRTWEFVLPPEAVYLFAGGSGTFDLHVVINPPGPDQVSECPTCFDDNNAYLSGNQFQRISTWWHTPGAFLFRPHLVRTDVLNPDGSTSNNRAPTLNEVADAVRAIQDMLPIGDGLYGPTLMPPINVYWSGPLADWNLPLDNWLISRYLPGGEIHAAPPYDYYAFFHAPGNCSGHVIALATDFLRAAAEELPCVDAPHELNHAIGAHHAGNSHGEEGGGGYDTCYPGSHGQVESNTWGMNVYTMRLYPPTYADGSHYHDFMSYGGTRDSWVSLYSWNLTTKNLGTPIAPDPVCPSSVMERPWRLANRSSQTPFRTAAGDSLVDDAVAFRGILGPGGQVDLAPFFASFEPDSGEGDGTYLLQFLDADDQLLGSHSLRPAHGVGIEQDETLFAEAIKPPAGWRKLTLLTNDVATQTWLRKSNPPTVVWTSPSPGFHWPNHGIQTLTWADGDPSPDPMHYRILGIQDPSLEVYVLAAGLTSQSVDLDLSELPSGGSWTLFVEISDGFDHAFSAGVSGTVDPTPPRALIVRPAEGDVYVAGSDVPATGLIADLQEAPGDSSFSWFLDDQFVSYGAVTELPDIAPGTRHLTLVARNGYQLADSFAVNFLVVDSLPPPQLLTPPDHAQQVPLPCLLGWNAVPGAISYRVQVAADSAFESIVLEAGNLDTTGVEFDPGAPDQKFYWRAKAEHGTSPSDWSGARTFTSGYTTSVGDAPGMATLSLSVFPNPASFTSTIAYRLPRAGNATVDVYDVAGRHLRRLVARHHEAGSYSVPWDGTTGGGTPVGAGVYLVRIGASAQAAWKRVIVIR